jgi:hypothetical protein
MRRNSKRGGFTCFLTIILTSVILLLTILSKASSIRCEETLLTGILVQQQDLVLSGYSEKLLDWYGIYATSMKNDQKEAFIKASSGIDRLESYSCAGANSLDAENNLEKAILSFSRPRVPVQLSLQLLSRFTRMNQLIETGKQNVLKQDVLEKPVGDSPKPRIPVKETSTVLVGFEDILRLLGQLGTDTMEKTSQESGSITWVELNEMLKNSMANNVFEMDVSKEMKANLSFTENNLNEISAFLEQFCSIENNSFYDGLCLEFYASSMFSCKTNTRIQNGIEIERQDLRSRTVSGLPVRSRLEIEKIIFGSSKDATNESLTKISIETIRFLIHLVTNATNGEKKAEITATALALCAAAAIATGGTVTVPEKAMEVVVLLLTSMNSAARDYSTLIKGDRVLLIPISSAENMDTYYTDYLQLFLFTIPKKVKLKRMASIMCDNLYLTGIPLYTGVTVSVSYRDIPYKVTGCYGG